MDATAKPPGRRARCCSTQWAGLTIGLAFAMPAGAAVLGFDDLGSSTGPFLAADNGFTFGTNDAQTTVWLHSTQAAPRLQPHSGAGYVLTDGRFYDGGILDPAQAISRVQPFVFEGAWFTGVNQVNYTLYSGNTLVFQTPESPELTATPMFVASGYSGLVTSVVIAGPQGRFAMDDFTFTSPVPEPSGAALMAVGLVGLVFGTHRQGRRAR